MTDTSFDEFVSAYIGALDRYAYALTGDRYAAEDLVQETLVRLLGAWHRVRRDGNPVGYATTVMFRTYVSLGRQRRRRATVELSFDPPAGSDAYAPTEARLTLDRAFRGLPRLQRAVLVASFLLDHPDDRIAEMIGRRPATVRSLRHRGLKQLAIVMGEPPAAEADPVPSPSARPSWAPSARS